jgi:hypothetical protein
MGAAIPVILLDLIVIMIQEWSNKESSAKRQKHSKQYRHRLSHDSWPPTEIMAGK